MKLVHSLSIVSFMAVAVASQAQVTSISTPFASTHSENFESFQNYFTDPNFYLSEPASIMGGFASLTSGNHDIAIYQPSSGATFGLGYGSANVHSGLKGMGLNSYSDSSTVTFATGVKQFGGYFNSLFSSNISFSFFDQNGDQIGLSLLAMPASNLDLTFMGFSSTVDIYSVTFSGDYLVADDLQAGPSRVSSVPGPAAAASFALMALRRRKRQS